MPIMDSGDEYEQAMEPLTAHRRRIAHTPKQNNV